MIGNMMYKMQRKMCLKLFCNSHAQGNEYANVRTNIVGNVMKVNIIK